MDEEKFAEYNKIRDLIEKKIHKLGFSLDDAAEMLTFLNEDVPAIMLEDQEYGFEMAE